MPFLLRRSAVISLSRWEACPVRGKVLPRRPVHVGNGLPSEREMPHLQRMLNQYSCLKISPEIQASRILMRSKGLLNLIKQTRFRKWQSFAENYCLVLFRVQEATRSGRPNQSCLLLLRLYARRPKYSELKPTCGTKKVGVQKGFLPFSLAGELCIH